MTPEEALRIYWGFSSFRPLQREIVESVLCGRDTLALLPTGGGKSLCYQVPAVCSEGVTLVISPLIALMNDQVAALQKKGIRAAAITSQLSKREWLSVLDNWRESDVKLLYLSPEKLQNSLLQEKLGQLKISFIAVDEAHCISQWGHDFRPAYRQIDNLREVLPPDTAVLALTATATPEVIDDIATSLRFRPGHQVFKKSFHRPNLSYNIRIVENKIDRLIQALRAVPGSAIVFMRHRLKTAQVAQFLRAHGIMADYYHAGLTAEERMEKQNDWMQGKTRVIAATNAFGMGIDKPEVRLVVHLDPVPSLEEYFQEAGRAGRDEKLAYAVSFISPADIARLTDPSNNPFPSPDEIAEVYQKLFEFLRIPLGQGEWEKFPFSIQKFAEYTKLPKLKCYEILRWLERDGHISFDDQCLRHSRLHFYFDFYDLSARHSPESAVVQVVQNVLRMYEGVRYTLVEIDEARIAKMAEVDEPQVKKILYHLSRTGDADYYPKNTEGFLTLLKPRLDRKIFKIDPEEYSFRKARHQARLESVKKFYQSTNQCRVIQLLHYLGEKKTEPCGLCDFCRDQRRMQKNPSPHSLQLRKASEKEIITRQADGQILFKKT
ncbi:ATP-dependent DNA helicase RecQ [Thermaurantimonas aggregans]|uniref:ATP-dependent DNA helicase RecQ n=1 Tax=Thermaurantimonas aggregans TaxID=2173829 RepID=A0A401XHS6_9FLAO|nr:ATP-dependent DNA helicase RecQ [Thermaurantimonas aggregans]MCX8149446.1 RecQ family ATP-dependent DNA helicase [Thermaurantimonas aggregans]GCD76567.1 ATP-dependent DNA helicase RecQ [Thermaurantimonas aggregans]